MYKRHLIGCPKLDAVDYSEKLTEIFRSNDKVSESGELNKYDVYYYSESLQTVWIYTCLLYTSPEAGEYL